MRADRTARASMAVVLTALLVSGCSLFSGSNGSNGSNGSAPASLAQDGTVEGSQASLTRRYQGYDVTVDVLRLVRHEKAIRAEFAITPSSKGSAANALSTSILGGTSDASGVYLLDEANLRKYVVLRSADDQCICSSDIESFPLGQPALLFADFPVAPADVTSLSLVVPELGPLPVVDLS